MAHHDIDVFPIVLRELIVQEVRDVTPRMRRVRLGGPDFPAFERDGAPHGRFESPGFDDHIKVIFAEAGPIEAVLPRQLENGIEWTETPGRLLRDYTPRAVNHEEGFVDLDFVRHGHGPAASWAEQAQVGQSLWVVGPKSSTKLPASVDQVILIGDETALPAIGRYFDERPSPAPVQAFIAIESEEARQELALGDGDSVRWFVGKEGHDMTAMLDLVSWHPGQPYVWAAGQSQRLLPVRRLLKREHGVESRYLNITGYWHANANAGVVPLRRIESPVAWYVLRAALKMGLLEAAAGGEDGLDSWAAQRGVELGVVQPLIQILLIHEVLVHDDRGLRLGALGEYLMGDDHESGEITGPQGDVISALALLDQGILSGSSAWEVSAGESYAASAGGDPQRAAALAEEAESLSYLTPAIAAHPLWQGQRVAVAGAEPVVTALGPVAASVVHDSAGLRASAAPIGVLAMALGHLTDVEARELLAQISTKTRTVVLIEQTAADELDAHAAEDAVLSLAMTGRPPRDLDELGALAQISGWTAQPPIQVGWGVALIQLTRDGAATTSEEVVIGGGDTSPSGSDDEQSGDES